MKTANVMDFSAGIGSYKLGSGDRELARRTEDAAALFGSMMNQFGSMNLWSRPKASADLQDAPGIVDSPDAMDYSRSSYAAGKLNITQASETPSADQMDEAQEQLSQFTEDITQAVSGQLDVPQDEVVKAMEKMGIDSFDLLDPQILGKLVMQLTGEQEPEQLLVNTDFQALMREIGQLGRELMKELELAPAQLNELRQQLEVSEIPMPEDFELKGEALSEGTAQSNVQSIVEQQMPEDTDLHEEGIMKAEAVAVESQEQALLERQIPSEEQALSSIGQTAEEQSLTTEQTAAEEPNLTTEQTAETRGLSAEQTTVEEQGISTEQTAEEQGLTTDQTTVEKLVLTTDTDKAQTAVEHQSSFGNPAASGQLDADEKEQTDIAGADSKAEVPDESAAVSVTEMEEQAADSQTGRDSSFSADGRGMGRPQQMTTDSRPEFVSISPEVSVGGFVPEAPQGEISYVDFNTLEFMNQVAENVRAAVQNQVTSLEMQLNPEQLGKIFVTLTSKDGAVNAQLAAANEAVRAALETQISTLRENLSQAGVKVNAIEVTVAAHEFEQNLEQNARGEQEQAAQQEQRNSGRRNISLGSLDELSGVMSEEERLVAQIMQDNGNSMDITA